MPPERFTDADVLAHAAARGQPADTVRSPFRLNDGRLVVKVGGGGGWVLATRAQSEAWGPD